MSNIFIGTVIHGEGRGKQLGFPTANIELLDSTSEFPEFGVWASRVKLGNLFYHGATSIGLNSTFESTAPTFETYILDFDEDIYGEVLEVELIQYIRPMKKFDSLESLVIQIKKDVELARLRLSKN